MGDELKDMVRIDLDEWLDEKIKDGNDNVSHLAESMKERFQVEQNPEEPVHTLTTHFQFGDLPVIEIGNDDLLFLADDAAEWLGFDSSIKAVNDYCGGRVQRLKVNTDDGIKTLAFITEQDLYALSFSSDTPAAREFTGSMMSAGVKVLKGELNLNDHPRNDMDSARLAFNDVVARVYAEKEIVATNDQEAADKAQRLAELKKEFYKCKDDLNKAFGFDK